MSGHASTRADWIDALLWFAIPCILLMIVPIGFASNDGVGHSAAFATGQWELNPNHLLFEPLGAWWQSTAMALGYPRAPFDALKLLSILSGSIAVALFRLCIAPAVTNNRFVSNHATAWMAFSSAFLRLWISDETHMIQMPAVTAMCWMTLRCIDRRSFLRGFLLGVATGLAALTFISNALLGVALAGVLVLWRLWQREIRAAIFTATSIALGFLAMAGPPLLLAWSKSAGSVTFFQWMTRYGGGALPTRVRDAYGISGGFAGTIPASVRAIYGAACAIVDVTSAGAAVRDRQPPGIYAVGAILALSAAMAVLVFAFLIAVRRAKPHTDRVLMVVIPASLAIVLFGIYWNNSDDQFYFQLAPIVGLLVCLIPISRRSIGILILSGFVLLWNVCDVAVHRVFYPREQRIATLETETRGTCLVVTPGFDEAELLLEISRHPSARISVADLASTYPFESGMAMLSARIDRCVSSGGRVEFIDVFDTPRERSPWKFLRRLGYERTAVERVLARFPMDKTSRRVGPFTVRVTP